MIIQPTVASVVFAELLVGSRQVMWVPGRESCGAAKQDQDLIPVTVGLIADAEAMSQGYGLHALQGGCQGAGMSWGPHRAVEP